MLRPMLVVLTAALSAGCATGSNGYDCGSGSCDDASDVTFDAARPLDASQPTHDAATGTDASTGGAFDAALDAARDVAGPPLDAGIDSRTVFDAPADVEVETGVDASPVCTVHFTEHFNDNAQGWTLDPSWSIGAPCASPPAPQKGNPDPAADHTGGASGVAGAYVCGNNPSGASAPTRYATSPEIDLSGAPSAKLSFYRWLNSDQPTWMTSTVDVYDGSAWQNVYKNPSSLVTDSGWTRVEYDVTAYENAHFRVRFGYALLSSSVYAMSDWNVDDLVVESGSCP